MTSRALSVDPGGTIGACVGKVLPLPDLLTVLWWAEETNHQAFLEMVEDWLIEHRLNWIIVENFVPRGGVRTWQPEALHQIGVLLYLGRKYGVPVFLQQVGDAEKFATKTKLTPFLENGYGRGGAGHALMALKHLVLWRYTHDSLVIA